jgi:hypothetical protein
MTANRTATLALAFTWALAVAAADASAQAAPTATGPGSYISVGLEASGFQQDYGQNHVGGEGLFVDANLFRRYGVEFEARRLNFHTEEDVKEQTYLGGVKYSALPRTLRPYVKLLAGRGTIDFPFHYAVGSYFVVAPAAGLDWHLRESRWNVRVLDFEYQLWPHFTYGELHPYGLSAGVSFEFFQPGGYPRGRRFHTK